MKLSIFLSVNVNSHAFLLIFNNEKKEGAKNGRILNYSSVFCDIWSLLFEKFLRMGWEISELAKRSSISAASLSSYESGHLNDKDTMLNTLNQHE